SISFTRPQENDDDMTTEAFTALTKKHNALLLEDAVREGRILPRDREQFTRRYPDARVEDVEAFIKDTPRPPKAPDRVTMARGNDALVTSGRADFRVAEAAEKLILERRVAGDPLPGQWFEQR